jgi:serine/threonine-protein kinase
MHIEPGQQLLHYRLTEKIGEGGMGVVWKAEDTSLGREVAVKILPHDFAADAERLARFEREARLLATLNHPNVAGIYGLHEADGTHFLAMELIPGEDLSASLERGAMTVDKALAVARDVAIGLEAAHENGVIHRDLKPANVKLMQDGTAKVLDFGLAKAADAASAASGNPAHSPTLTSAGTVAGMILGTAAYMSPEQAAGQPIDRRCDIWSFGVLLYELLVGKKLFEGETISHTLAAVLRAEVDLEALPEATPPAIRRLLERCLDRDARRRLRDIGEARIALEEAIEHPERAASPPTTDASPRASRLPWWILAAVVLLGLAGIFLFPREEPEPEPIRRFTVTVPNFGGLRQGDGNSIAVSPDGRTIVTRGGAGTDDILYARRLDSFDIRPIPGSSGAQNPIFSPDGEWVAFMVSNGLYKIRLGGGSSTHLGALSATLLIRGFDWGSDDHIYYTDAAHVWRKPVDGGDSERLTQEGAIEGWIPSQPDALPDKGVVLFHSTGDRNAPPQLKALSIEDGTITDLRQTGSHPCAPSSWTVTTTRSLPTSHPTASGSPTFRTSPATTRSTSLATARSRSCCPPT